VLQSDGGKKSRFPVCPPGFTLCMRVRVCVCM
jgi:hypothetical protein